MNRTLTRMAQVDGESRRRRGAVSVTVLACAIVLLTAVPVHAATEVSGRINADTTWTASGSPYVLSGDVELAYGSKLTVEPGAVILGGGKLLEVYGTFSAEGTAEEPIVIRDTHLRGRGTYTLPSTLETFTVDVRYADVDGGSLQGGGLSMYGSWKLSDSIVSNTDLAMYLWYPRADCAIERNVFLNAGKISVGLHQADLYVTNNIFFRSSSEGDHDVSVENWAAFGGHHVVAALNTFMNPGTLAVSLPDWSSSGSMSALNNYWSVPADDAAAIASMVFDKNDNLSSPGIVGYDPALGGDDAATPTARLPLTASIDLAAGTTTPVYPGGTSLTSAARDARDAAVRGTAAVLYASADGLSWTKAAEAFTDAQGAASFPVDPAEPTYYRVATDGNPAVYAYAESPAVLLSPRHAVSLTLLPAGVRISSGVSVTLSGNAKDSSGKALADKAVALQSSPDGVVWATATNALTSGAGGYTFVVGPSRKTYYRTVFAGDDRYAPATSALSLVTSLQSVYRFFNVKQGVHFYTSSEDEKNDVMSRLSEFYRYEGVGYTLDLANPAMDAPLYRFYNFRQGVHFYTASVAEKDAVIANLSSVYRYEGIAYNVSRDADGGVPVYRFLNLKQGVHFYTASEAEKNDVIARLGTVYRYEGVAYYIYQ